ncbi:MAG: serine hydrolase [Bacteroidota bacterium]
MTTRSHMSFWIVLCLLLVVLITISPKEELPEYRPAPFLTVDAGWADSVWHKMETESRIGEMFMVVTDHADTTEPELTALISQYQVGGVLFRGYPIQDQYRLTHALQHQPRHPLLIGMDATNIADSLIQIPHDLSFAAIRDDSLLREIGRQAAVELQALGVHLYLTPSLQANFQDENTEQIVNNLAALNRGFQQAHVLLSPTEVVPYFPYERDSARIEYLLHPYDQMSQAGFAAMMIESEVIDRIHLNSQKTQIIQSYLEKNIAYRGLLLGEVEKELGDVEDQVRKMLKAGTDLILVRPDQLPIAMATARDLVSRNFFSDEELKENGHKLLLAKSWSDASRMQWTSIRDTLSPPSNDARIRWNNRQLAQAHLTLVQNNNQQIPFSNIKDKATHLLVIGDELPDLLSTMRTYGPVSTSHIPSEDNEGIKPLKPRILAEFDPVVIVLNEQSEPNKIDPDFMTSLETLAKMTEVIIVNVGEDLSPLTAFESYPSLVQVYDNLPLDQQLLGQLLWGGVSPGGRLPVSLSDRLTYDQGRSTPVTRLAFSQPEEVGIASGDLARIDSIVQEGIHAYAMPGCQVLVAKGGKVIYNQAFGHHTYARKRRVYPSDLYDLASVTKVAATTVASMKMDQDDRLHPDDRLSRFFRDQLVIMDSVSHTDTLFVHKDSLPVLKKDSSPFVLVSQRSASSAQPATDTVDWGADSLLILKTWKMGQIKRRGQIFDLKISELLTHHSGLPAGLAILPFLNYRDSLVGKYDRYYHASDDSLYSIQVAGDFFMREDYWDSLWMKTKATNVSPAKAYEYSDANMILVQQAIDSINQEPMNVYLQRELYQGLGMQNTSFNPRQWCEPERIVPTTYDGAWRGQLLRGYVHDPTAALLGGVSGNAGLFSNAQDLAHLFQMLLNLGHYGGERFMDPNVVREYTRKQGGHRGYGFDKPPTYRSEYIIGSQASQASFGHTGFTGTCAWVDPEEELVYIFLSNRVHPKPNNWKLNELKIRQRIHDVVYDAIRNAYQIEI